MKKICLGVIAAVSVISVCQAEVVIQTQPAAPATQAEQMSKVTLKIQEPASVRQVQQSMRKPNEITLGERTFKLPAGIEQVTVMHNFEKPGMSSSGKPRVIQVAINGSTCKIELANNPMRHVNKMITIQVGQDSMGKTFCEKAVVSGA